MTPYDVIGCTQRVQTAWPWLGAGGIYICTHAPTAPRGRHIYMPKRLCVLYGLPALTCLTIADFLHTDLRGCP